MTILKNRRLVPWNDGYWSEALYFVLPKIDIRKDHPKAIVDEEEGFIYKPIMMQRGTLFYARWELD